MTGLTRRTASLGLAGGLASALLPSGPAAAEAPPSLSNGRHQFTEVDPVRPLPAIALPDMRGRLQQLPPAPGRVGLLHIWATWCPACRAELGALRHLTHDGVTRDGVTRDGVTRDGVLAVADLVTVSTDEEQPAAVERFLRDAGLADMPVLLDPGGRRLTAPRPDGSPSAVQPVALPMTYVTDAAGGVRGYIAGPIDWQSADAAALLAFYGHRSPVERP